MATPEADPWAARDPWGGSQDTQPTSGYSYAPVGSTPEAETKPVWSVEGAAQEGSTATGGSWGDFEGGKEKKSADSWSSWGQKEGNNDNSWSSWGNSGGTNEKMAEAEWQEHIKKLRWKDFNEAQDWYKENNILPGRHEEVHLFEHCDKSGGGEDFSLLDNASCEVTGPKADQIPKITTFEDLFRNKEFSELMPLQLQENVSRCGFSKPTPVQRFAIPVGLAGRDVMCCAQTGSGKTAAFLVPMLASMLKSEDREGLGKRTTAFEGTCKPDVLIMTPTRELCVQIYEDALKFLYQTDFRAVRVYGQEQVKTQIKEIAKGADVCVATPGRLKDFTSAGIIELCEVNCLVLDEADRMLEMGSGTDIKEIIEDFGMPKKENRQTMMFSATFPEEIQKLATAYLFDYLFVKVGAIGSACVTVTQMVEQVNKEEKPDKLMELIDVWMSQRDKSSPTRMLIFTNSKLQAKGLDEKLWDKNVCNSGSLHGDLSQPEREANLTKFRDGQIDVMVATDVASRGLDISGVSHVVNYDCPFEISVYVQRIGRTGRIGHRGTAITFIAMDKQGYFLDREEVLVELPAVMEGAPNTEVPDWLKSKAEELKKGKWDTKADKDKENTDARETWESWKDHVQESATEHAPGTWTASQQPANSWNSGNTDTWSANQQGQTAQSWGASTQ